MDHKPAQITTNHQPRHTIDALDLTPDEQLDFLYHDWDALIEGEESATFFRYKDTLYDLAQFQMTTRGGELHRDGWDAMQSDTFWSATLIKLQYDHGDLMVIVGSLYQP